MLEITKNPRRSFLQCLFIGGGILFSSDAVSYTHLDVYKRQDCTQFYIGQTGRSFKLRYKEHIPVSYTHLDVYKRQA